jgi:hypothetical protein
MNELVDLAAMDTASGALSLIEAMEKSGVTRLVQQLNRLLVKEPKGLIFGMLIEAMILMNGEQLNTFYWLLDDALGGAIGIEGISSRRAA